MIIGTLPDGRNYNSESVELRTQQLKPEAQYRIIADVLAARYTRDDYYLALCLGDGWIKAPPIDRIMRDGYQVLFISMEASLHIRLLVHGQAICLSSGQVIVMSDYKNNSMAVNGILSVEKNLIVKYGRTFPRII